MVAKEDLKDWMDGFRSERNAFQSVALLAEVRLSETINNTQGMGTPNPVMTRVVCELLSRISSKLGRYRSIIDKLLVEVLRCIYIDVSCSDPEPYFLKYQMLLQENSRLSQTQNSLMRQQSTMNHVSTARMSVIERLISKSAIQAMGNAFHIWRAETAAQKELRKRVTKLLAKWAKFDWLSELRESRTKQAVDEMRTNNQALMQAVEIWRTKFEETLRSCESLQGELEAAQVAVEEANERTDKFKQALAEAHLQLKDEKQLELQELASICQNPSLLLQPLETSPLSLNDVPKPELVMRWINHHLTQLGQETVSNFSTDFADGRVLAALCHIANPKACPLKHNTDEASGRAVAQKVLQDMTTLLGMPEGMLTVDDILNGSSDLLYSACCHVMEYFGSLDRAPADSKVTEELAKAQAEVEQFARLDLMAHQNAAGALQSFIAALTKVCETVNAYEQKLQAGHALFKKLTQAASRYAKHMYTQRAAGEVVEILAAKSADNLFSAARLVPMLGTKPEERDAAVVKLRTVWRRYGKQLGKLFSRYATAEASTSGRSTTQSESKGLSVKPGGSSMPGSPQPGSGSVAALPMSLRASARAPRRGLTVWEFRDFARDMRLVQDGADSIALEKAIFDTVALNDEPIAQPNPTRSGESSVKDAQQQAAESVAPATHITDKDGADEANTPQAWYKRAPIVTKDQWPELLLRVAVCLASEGTCWERLESLISGRLLPVLYSSDAGGKGPVQDFRNMLRNMDVRPVFVVHHGVLYDIFTNYARGEDGLSTSSVSSTARLRGRLSTRNQMNITVTTQPLLMSFEGAMQVLQDVGAIGPPFTEEDALQCYDAVAAAPPALAHVGRRSLTYTEWLEFISTCALMWRAHPFEPVAARIDTFIKETFVLLKEDG
eukprot:jgi/Chlat1/7424/Chrsp6S00596